MMGRKPKDRCPTKRIDGDPGHRGHFLECHEVKDRDTIAAISTPAGSGGVSIVRVSGPGALPVGDRIVRLRRGRRLSLGKTWSIALGEVVDPADGSVVDEVIAVVMRGPRSYTGEDVVEVQCHGGSLVTEKILSLALGAGARAAEAGEFTRRAFLSGRITLDQAEAVLDLVVAPGEASLREAARRLKGELGKTMRKWESHLLGILAVLSGSVDFPEDVSEETDEAMGELRILVHEVRELLTQAPLGLALSSGIQVCLVGRPNVGKSSLFNALLGHDRAIVTMVPGTTRDVLRERTQWAGLPVILLDTAGLCETSEIVEALGVRRATSAASESEVILYVVDDTEGLTSEDVGWISHWKDRRLLVVVNKVDVGARKIQSSDLSLLGDRYVMASGVSGEGLGQVKEMVTSYFARGGVPEGAIPGSARQVDCLQRAAQAMEDAVSQWEAGWTVDVLILSIEEALGAFAELTGRNVSRDTLDEVFAKFCVGK